MTASYPRVRTVEGRTLISRAEQHARTGLSVSHLRTLYARRAENGHPEVADQLGAAPYWDAEAWTAWLSGYQARKRHQFTDPDRRGDPDELVTAAEAARILGYRGVETITKWLRDNPGYFPEPDDTRPMGSGRVRRLWRRRTVWAFGESRDGGGGGRPAGSGAGERAPRYADHPLIGAALDAVRADPPPTAAGFARQRGIPDHTARRLLAAAREQLARD